MFQISYDGGDVVLVAVPEPATSGLLLGGLGCLLGWRRRGQGARLKAKSCFRKIRATYS
jgi:hypothetical protein